MLSEREVTAAVGSTAYGADGDKLGTVDYFFTDDRTGAPTWVAVSTGLFGSRHSIVPAVDATFADGGLRIPVTAEAVKEAPSMAGDHLDPVEEEALRRHYGIGIVGTDRTVEMPAVPAVPDVPPAAAPTERPVDRPTDGAMTRSEEQLRVGTERVATTRARLVKYVVTEEVQITVPIRREEIRVEQVPLDADDADWAGESLEAPAGSGTAGGLPDEIVLHTERPVVSVEVVPTERVRLRTELVQGQETVTEQVQREQIIVDHDTSPTTPPGISPR
jgi:stress response protein YsnF